MMNKLNSNTFYVTKDELEKLHFQLKEKWKELNEASKLIWEATDQSSETWHDNAPFDVAVEKTKLLDKQYKILCEKIKNAVVIDPQNKNYDRVMFWTKIKIAINFDGQKIVTISWISNLHEGKISVASPLAQALLWKKEWEVVNFQIGRNSNVVKILEIFNE